MRPVRVDDSDDRVGMYFSTWISFLHSTEHAVVKRIYGPPNTLTQPTRLLALEAGIKTLVHPMLKRFLNTTSKVEDASLLHRQRMEGFYKWQSTAYDTYRERLLCGRRDLMDFLPIKLSGQMVWVDVGGGTARNLEHFDGATIQKYFKAIYIVDICPSLLEVARQRVKMLKAENIIQIVEADFGTTELPSRLLSLVSTVDILTMSYSMAMIPNKLAAIDGAFKLLKPKGHGVFGMADFFLYSKRDSQLSRPRKLLRNVERAVHRWWFSCDGVDLITPAVVKAVRARTEIIAYHTYKRAVPLLPVLQPVHGVLMGCTR
eukprot:GHVS01027048.1.p2 GENE.GHVS01027048.1~~GHVS01027048.1.p2  ORF type:complete len:317 (-),score=42.36 GHVS01027048.1:32-982(-)